MENINLEIDELLKLRTEKLKKLEEEKYSKYGRIKEHLINLLEKLKPYEKAYGKLRKLYDGDGYKYTTYIIGKDNHLHFIKLTYCERTGEFLLHKEMFSDYYYTLRNLKEMTNEVFWNSFVGFGLKENDTFDVVFLDVMFMLNEWTNKLKKEVE